MKEVRDDVLGGLLGTLGMISVRDRECRTCRWRPAFLKRRESGFNFLGMRFLKIREQVALYGSEFGKDRGVYERYWYKVNVFENEFVSDKGYLFCLKEIVKYFSRRTVRKIKLKLRVIHG